jgi:putative transposase
VNTRTYYTAKELAGLPGMPGTESAVIRKAKAENWSFRKRAGRGGGKEYALASLPAETRDHLTDQLIAALPEQPAALPTERPETLPAVATEMRPATPAALKQWQRDTMDARLKLMRLIEQAVASGVRITKAVDRIAQHSRNSAATFLSIVRLANKRSGKDQGNRTLSARSLWRFWSLWNDSNKDPISLAPTDSSIDVTTGKQKVPVWAPALEACWRQPQHRHLTDVLERLQEVIPAGVPMPTYSQAQRYIKSMGAIEREKGRKTGLALSNLKPHRRRDTSHMYPGDAYTADGHTFDAEVAHPYHGRPFRPEITPVLDITTRKCIGWSCDLAESGLAVLDALRAACENYGPPVIFYTDNGKGYKNQMMTAEGTGILNRLGITPKYSRPRNPKAHGISERAHQTILIRAAKELCTFIGASMDPDVKQLVFKATRKALKTADQAKATRLLIEWDAFVEHVNQAVERYNNRPHTSLPAVRDPETGKRIHQSPNQAWALGYERMQKELPPDQWTVPANELPDLYHPMVERTVANGEISLGMKRNGLRKRYFSHDLAEYHGQLVHVSFSPSDPAQVWVRDIEHGRLLAVAKLDGNVDPYFAQSYLEEKREQRANGRLKRLQLQAEEIEAERRGTQPVIIEHTSEMKAMLEQLKAEEAEVQAPPTAKVVTLQLPEPEPVRAFAIPGDEREKYKLWCQLEGMVNGGIELQEDEQRFFDGFKRTAMWKAWKSVGK